MNYADRFQNFLRNCPRLRMGDMVEKAAKPIARVMRMDCLDEALELKPGSPCEKRKRDLNAASEKVNNWLGLKGH